MTVISPSILGGDLLNLVLELDYLKEVDSIWLHLDVMDGHFVPNLTFGPEIIEQIVKRYSFTNDVHLMVTNPRFHLEKMKDWNIHNVTIHLESLNNPKDFLSLKNEFKSNYKSIGFSIKPNTTVESIPVEVIKSTDLVLVMSVEPGFAGQKFMPQSLEKIKKLVNLKKENGLSFSIQIDGGISDQTYKDALNAGAQNLVVGSYLFKKDRSEYRKVIQNLRG